MSRIKRCRKLLANCLKTKETKQVIKQAILKDRGKNDITIFMNKLLNDVEEISSFGRYQASSKLRDSNLHRLASKPFQRSLSGNPYH